VDPPSQQRGREGHTYRADGSSLMSPTATSAAHLALCSRAPDVNAVRGRGKPPSTPDSPGAALRRRPCELVWARATCAALDVSTGLGRDVHHPAEVDMPEAGATVRVVKRRRRYLVQSPFAQAAHCVPQLRSLLLSRGLRLHPGCGAHSRAEDGRSTVCGACRAWFTARRQPLSRGWEAALNALVVNCARRVKTSTATRRASRTGGSSLLFRRWSDCTPHSRPLATRAAPQDNQLVGGRRSAMEGTAMGVFSNKVRAR